LHAAEQAVYEKLRERNVVSIHLGNDLYPTEARAKQFGIPQADLHRIFWNGVNTDYARLQSLGERVMNLLASGTEVKITAPNGTNLTMQIANREVFVSDGVVSQTDRSPGGPAAQVWLPAGEVYLAPVPGTANGTFIADTFFHEGKLIEALKLEFKAGKLTNMTAKSDISALRKLYDAAPAPARDVFAAVDIGINAGIEVPKNSRMITWMAAGTISVGIGDNRWAGGENSVPYGLFAQLIDGTLAVDGRNLIDRGRLLEK
jgi:leucyl aminopeptidase (aminopeptidase T)